ncbi:MAG TPA: hypothetical protein VJ397_03710 [Thermoplasmata archaeon]|nr:hypothetical protein [Thermoplasmata archaeon]
MRRLSPGDRDFLRRLRLVMVLAVAVLTPIPLYFAIFRGQWAVLLGLLLMIGYISLLAGLTAVPYFVFRWGLRASVLVTAGAALVVVGLAMISLLQVPSHIPIAFALGSGIALIAVATVLRHRP